MLPLPVLGAGGAQRHGGRGFEPGPREELQVGEQVLVHGLLVHGPGSTGALHLSAGSLVRCRGIKVNKRPNTLTSLSSRTETGFILHLAKFGFVKSVETGQRIGLGAGGL